MTIYHVEYITKQGYEYHHETNDKVEAISIAEEKSKDFGYAVITNPGDSLRFYAHFEKGQFVNAEPKSSVW